jgi:hypothetical protein
MPFGPIRNMRNSRLTHKNAITDKNRNRRELRCRPRPIASHLSLAPRLRFYLRIARSADALEVKQENASFISIDT